MTQNYSDMTITETSKKNALEKLKSGKREKIGQSGNLLDAILKKNLTKTFSVEKRSGEEKK